MPSTSTDGEGSRDSGRPRLNPEIAQSVHLPGLEDVQTFVVRRDRPAWMRWAEGIALHVVAGGLLIVLAFVAGLVYAVMTEPSVGLPKQPQSDISDAPG